MKRLAITILAAVLSTTVAFAQGSSVSDIDIDVLLSGNGTALITERWDVDIHRGTEWYLVRDNLGSMRISDLSVSDETGRPYVYEGGWDIHRDLAGKAGRCGIVSKDNGCEICWGLGSYGVHTFTVRYTMTNAVQALEDCCCLHIQFVSPGISPYPEHAKVTLRSEEHGFNEDNTGIWAFGYKGQVQFEDGAIVAETQEPFRSDEYSMIVLARFGSSLFTPAVSVPKAFQDVLDTAFEGSSYEEYLENQKKEKIRLIIFVLLFSVIVVLAVLSAIRTKRKQNMRFFGVAKTKEIGYERDLPFNGDLLETRYVINRGRQSSLAGESCTASALILRMIDSGVLNVTKDSRGKVLIGFTEGADTASMPDSQKTFYDFLKEAAGEDGILKEKEFTKWSLANADRVDGWAKRLTPEAGRKLMQDGYLYGDTFTAEGQKHARRVIGFNRYLKEFTLLNERSTAEITLWRDYIIYAALYGIAAKVAKELRDIDPKMFEEMVGYDYPTIKNLIYLSNRMGVGMTTSVMDANHQTSGSVGGHGGFSSFGGGGGFGGGGFGGGAR